jgi:hypothetical protein
MERPECSGDARRVDIRFVESKDSRMPGTVRFISRVSSALPFT